MAAEITIPFEFLALSCSSTSPGKSTGLLGSDGGAFLITPVA